MFSHRETPALVLALLITLGLLTVGLRWSLGSLATLHLQGLRLPPRSAEVARISQGELLLLPAEALPEKRLGSRAVAHGRYAEAVIHFDQALRAAPGDPETHIYRANAEIGTVPAYTLAVVVALAGDRPTALEVLQGVAQAQQTVNQNGGIHGVPLRVAIATDENSAEQAIALARHLTQDAAILGVVGHGSEATTRIAIEQYAAGGLTVMSPLSSSVTLTNVSPYLRRTVPSDFIAARALAQHLLNRHQRVVVAYSSESDESRSLKDEFATALVLGGGQVVQEVDLSSASFSPGATVEQAIALGATVLALVPSATRLERGLQLVRVNAGRLGMVAGSALYAPQTLEVGGPDAIGLVVAVPWHAQTAGASPFVVAAQQQWGREVSWRTAAAYDAVQSLVAAMRVQLPGALSRSPNRQSIGRSLQDLSFFAEGATSIVRFLPSGDRNQGVQLVEVRPGLHSGYGYDFVPIGVPPSPPRTEALGMARP
ncbi:MAG: ABC transporter substrate-binding protein [Kaiparowitsia implicata GSE-PSE-MK54-09C]|jgi:branched-chain amino acid transport system substrate-binding protein|nr:ABC transporter substrate-binding protein [Kaiparowitsia implicata GSE-PSE-MK54-09C]